MSKNGKKKKLSLSVQTIGKTQALATQMGPSQMSCCHSYCTWCPTDYDWTCLPPCLTDR